MSGHSCRTVSNTLQQVGGIYISDGKSDENEPRSTVTLRRNTIQANQQDGIAVYMISSDYRTTKLATRQYRKRF